MSHSSPTPNPESGPRPSGPPQTHTAPRALAQEFEDDLRRRLVQRAAKMAIAACMDGDDADAADRIDSLTDEQLKTVQDAAVALSLHASRLRKARENGHDHADAEPVPGTDDAIRASIATALGEWQMTRAIVCEHTQIISYGEAADAVMTALRPHMSAIDALWRRAEQAEAAVQRARDLAEDMRNITGARAWADRLETALTSKDAPTDTTAADIGAASSPPST